MFLTFENTSSEYIMQQQKRDRCINFIEAISENIKFEKFTKYFLYDSNCCIGEVKNVLIDRKNENVIIKLRHKFHKIKIPIRVFMSDTNSHVHALGNLQFFHKKSYEIVKYTQDKRVPVEHDRDLVLKLIDILSSKQILKIEIVDGIDNDGELSKDEYELQSCDFGEMICNQFYDDIYLTKLTLVSKSKDKIYVPNEFYIKYSEIGKINEMANFLETSSMGEFDVEQFVLDCYEYRDSSRDLSNLNYKKIIFYVART